VSVFHDGCTAGPLSDWMNSLVRSCCDLHDSGLDHTFDLGTFVHQNWAFAQCVWVVSPVLSVVVFLVVAGPAGLLMYYFGPKTGGSQGPSAGPGATPTATGPGSGLPELPAGRGDVSSGPSTPGAAP
jgi:hypothetical protein